MSELRRVGKYVVEREHEDGSLLARDPVLDRAVTLVLLAAGASNDDRARFSRQARAAAAIDHPNVVRVLETGEDQGRPFIAYERVDGPTLAESKGSPKMDRWLVDVATALQAMHEAAILHRAVRPENVRIASNGKAKLGGFSMARPANAAPDSFRTRTMSGPVDNELVDRVQWADMALGLGSPKLARIAKLARADRFETTSTMVDALDDDEPRTGGTAVFVVAVLATLALGGVAAFVALRVLPSRPPPPPAPRVNAVVDAATVPLVASVAPPPPPVASSSAGRRGPADAGATLPDSVTVLIPTTACFHPDDAKRITAAYQRATSALAHCIRDKDEYNETVTTARLDMIIDENGSIRKAVSASPTSVRDRDCLEELADKLWPQGIEPTCAAAEQFQVFIFRGCYCPPDNANGRPRCSTCTTPSSPKELTP